MNRLDYQKLIHTDSFADDILVVNWCLTNICNFKCSYCPETLHDGSAPQPEIETLKKFIDKAADHYNGKKIFFEFTGGEVTFYKKFTELISYIKEKGHLVGVISNGSRPLKFWEERIQNIDHVCLSYHPEMGDMDTFYQNVVYLSSRVTTHVNVMMMPEHFYECYLFAKKIYTEVEDISVAMQALMDEMVGDMFSYTEEQKEILNKQLYHLERNYKHYKSDDYRYLVARGSMTKIFSNGDKEIINTPEIISNGENVWTGWSCNIGLENIVIDFFGNIRRGWCEVGGIFGNIMEKEIRFPVDPIICNKAKCHCGTDILATKVRQSS